MPIKDFGCPRRHVTQVLVRASESPPSAPCEFCDATATPIGVWNIREFKCLTCGKRTLATVDASQHGAMETWWPCRTCGAPAAYRPPTYLGSWSVAVNGASGGYFDKGFGCWVHSTGHREELMAKHGVVPLDSDISTVEREFSAEASAGDAEMAAYNQYMDDLEHHPKYAEYREMRDKGMFDDPEEDSAAAETITVNVRLNA